MLHQRPVLHNIPISADTVLFNAEQSSTISGYPANRAIDGDWNTNSRTALAAGTELWFQVSMSNTTVYQIVLKAQTSYNKEITVSLYSGETLAGQCKSHTGSPASRDTLSCDRVTADRVRLTISSTLNTRLEVYEIKVPTMTIGLYQPKF